MRWIALAGLVAPMRAWHRRRGRRCGRLRLASSVLDQRLDPGTVELGVQVLAATRYLSRVGRDLLPPARAPPLVEACPHQFLREPGGRPTSLSRCGPKLGVEGLRQRQAEGLRARSHGGSSCHAIRGSRGAGLAAFRAAGTYRSLVSLVGSVPTSCCFAQSSSASSEPMGGPSGGVAGGKASCLRSL